MARQTLCFSKDLRHHVAATALEIAAYNFVKVHGVLRVPPAMQLQVTDHVWTVGELIERALAEPAPPPIVTVPIAPLPGQLPLRGMPPALRLIQGGRR